MTVLIGCLALNLVSIPKNILEMLFWARCYSADCSVDISLFNIDTDAATT